MLSKRCISSVVSITMLLLVVVVVAVSFESWYQTYSTGIRGDISEDPIKGIISAEALTMNDLYLKSEGSNYVSSVVIKDLQGNVKCELFNGSPSSSGGDTRLLMTFDNGAATDLSGYGNDGTLVGDVDCGSTGIDGSGCSFDGLNDKIEIDHDNYLTRDITVVSWIYINGTTPENFQRVVCGPNEYFCFWITNADDIGVRLSGTNRIVTTSSQVNFFNQNYEFQKWHQIGFTYDGGNTYLYLDGKKIISYADPGNSTHYYGDLATTAQTILNIGDSPMGAYYRPFNGTVDEVAIYSKALSENKIKALYHAKKALMYEQLIDGETVAIDVSSCDLDKERYYEIVAVANDQLIQRKFMVN